MQIANVNLVEFLWLVLIEAALWQTAMQWHLAAFETADSDAGTGRLTLAAASALLADARADTAADANAKLARACVVFDAVEPHGAKAP